MGPYARSWPQVIRLAHLFGPCGAHPFSPESLSHYPHFRQRAVSCSSAVCAATSRPSPRPPLSSPSSSGGCRGPGAASRAPVLYCSNSKRREMEGSPRPEERQRAGRKPKEVVHDVREPASVARRGRGPPVELASLGCVHKRLLQAAAARRSWGSSSKRQAPPSAAAGAAAARRVALTRTPPCPACRPTLLRSRAAASAGSTRARASGPIPSQSSGCATPVTVS